jgi:hypothetical protein
MAAVFSFQSSPEAGVQIPASVRLLCLPLILASSSFSLKEACMHSGIMVGGVSLVKGACILALYYGWVWWVDAFSFNVCATSRSSLSFYLSVKTFLDTDQASMKGTIHPQGKETWTKNEKNTRPNKEEYTETERMKASEKGGKAAKKGHS